MNRCLQAAEIPKCITKTKDHRNPKRPQKRNHYEQLLTYNVPIDDVEILTAQKREEINSSLIIRGLPPPKKNRKDAANQPQQRESYNKLTNTSPRRANRTEKSSYGVDWLQKKTYDMVPQSWIIDCFKMYKIACLFIKSIENTMEN